MKLFQVAMILTPTEKEAETGQSVQLIMEPTWKMAPNDQAAAMIAGRDLDAKYLDKLDRIQVLVRPF